MISLYALLWTAKAVDERLSGCELQDPQAGGPSCIIVQTPHFFNRTRLKRVESIGLTKYYLNTSEYMHKSLDERV